MNRLIKFKPDLIILPGYARFIITKTAFENIYNHPKGTNVLYDLSGSKVLLVTKHRNEGDYEVHTSEGIYYCTIKDNGLLVRGFNNNTLLKQNIAMKNGVCFGVSRGIIVELRLTDYKAFFDICNGYQYVDKRYENVDVTQSLRVIMEGLNYVVASQEEDSVVEEEDFQPDKRLINLLQISEHYSVLDNEIQEKIAYEAGKLPYSKINALDYDRVDRVAYQFVVDHVAEDVFKPGVQVEIKDKNKERHAGKIMAVTKKNETLTVDILFNDHFSVDILPSVGWISKSFSSIIKDVQLAANERIRNGEAAAKYMDLVLGKHSSLGFEDKDLSDLKCKLSQKKYPPNKSQMDAIFSGICAKDVFLVMGPPGTGKTTVILEWVKYFVKQEKKRVLVSSQSNKAVDNVLARIIEDKKIDIIRIGSETDIQSEIIPYMFENKVSKLREYISKHTQKNIDELALIAERWKNFSSEINCLIDLNQKVDDKRNQFVTVLRRDLIPIYQPLAQYYEQYSLVRQKIKDLEQRINIEFHKIEKYDRMLSIPHKILYGVGYIIRNAKLKKYVSKLDKLQEEEENICSLYNDLYQLYRTAYTEIKSTIFLCYYDKYQIRARAIEELKEKFTSVYNKWNLFSGINFDPKEWTNNNVFYEVNSLIKKEINRTEDLRQAVLMWKTDIESKQNYALNEIVLESVDLVGATCIGVNSQKRFANLDFDVTVIDEAGQIQIHNALVPMSVSNKLIMLGDHKQIPPIADQELVSLCEENGVDTTLLGTSLFEKMYNDLPEENKIMLDTQYRMPSEIADTISEWFYNGEYLSADFKKNLRSPIPSLSSSPFVIIDTSGERNRFETKITNSGCRNALEADIIVELVQCISEDKQIDLKEIGVITAYKLQERLIKEKLKGFLQNDFVSEMVATLDSFQGQERNIIIYSFTRSSNVNPNHRRIGFLNELRRLNVAMTRCKQMLILVGDMDFLSSCNHMERDEDGELIYEKSEKQFSDFIKKILNDVKNGRGDLISYKEFSKRMRSRGELQ